MYILHTISWFSLSFFSPCKIPCQIEMIFSCIDSYSLPLEMMLYTRITSTIIWVYVRINLQKIRKKFQCNIERKASQACNINTANALTELHYPNGIRCILCTYTIPKTMYIQSIIGDDVGWEINLFRLKLVLNWRRRKFYIWIINSAICA